MQNTRGQPLVRGDAYLDELCSTAIFEAVWAFEQQTFRLDIGLVTWHCPCPLEEKDSLAFSPPGNESWAAVLLLWILWNTKLLPLLKPTIALEELSGKVSVQPCRLWLIKFSVISLPPDFAILPLSIESTTEFPLAAINYQMACKAFNPTTPGNHTVTMKDDHKGEPEMNFQHQHGFIHGW